MRGTGGLAVVLAAIMAVAGGCDQASSPEDGFDAADAALIALEVDGAMGVLLDDVGGVLFGLGAADFAAAAAAEPRAFSRTASCPAGGTVSVSGQAERTRDGSVVEWSVNGTGVWAACAHTRRDRTTTIDGGFTFAAQRRRVDGEPSGAQTTTKSGNFTWTRSDGASGSCTFDLSSVRLPDAQKRTVTGTFCGRTIDRTVAWGKRG